MKRIHCVGVVVMDLLNGPIEQYPVPRHQSQVTAEWIRMMPGGGAANMPSAIARMSEMRPRGLLRSTFVSS